VSGIALSGTDAANYTANTIASATADITARGLTVSGITAADKVYDATTTATINADSATLAGVLSGDTVTLAAAGATGAFATKNAGTGKVVNVSGLSLRASMRAITLSLNPLRLPASPRRGSPSRLTTRPAPPASPIPP